MFRCSRSLGWEHRNNRDLTWGNWLSPVASPLCILSDNAAHDTHPCSRTKSFFVGALAGTIRGAWFYVCVFGFRPIRAEFFGDI